MLARARFLLRMYFKLIVLHIRTQLEYEADFWIGIVGAILYQGAGIIFIWTVFQGIPEVDGWTLPEVAILYALTIIPRGLAEVFGDGQWRLRLIVNSGEFDRVLVRPISPAFQVVTLLSSMHGFGSAILGGVIIAQSVGSLQVTWGLGDLLFLLATIVNGTILVCSINLAANSVFFWSNSPNNMFPMTVHNCLEFVKFPITLYGHFVQLLVTWGLPFAFVSYFPGLVLLGRSGGSAWPGYLALLSGPVVAGVTGLIWQRALLRYQGAGN